MSSARAVPAMLAGAGLLLTSFDRLTSVPPGFEPSQVVVASVTLPDGPVYPGLPQMRAFLSAVLDRLDAALPEGFWPWKPAVSAGYFRAMGIPLVLLALVASDLPARRAAHVDPLRALRAEQGRAVRGRIDLHGGATRWTV